MFYIEELATGKNNKTDLTSTAFDKSFTEIPYLFAHWDPAFTKLEDVAHWCSGGVFGGMFKNVPSAIFVLISYFTDQ